MRTVLRLIAVLAGLSVVATILFIFRFGFRGVEALLATGTFGALTIVGWLVDRWTHDGTSAVSAS
jgi:hypothetical protein